MGAFHAYDIRGIYQLDFDEKDVYKIGYYLPKVLSAKKILIGRDVRKSSPEIFNHLTAGVMDAGAHVYNAGITTTPMIYWGTAKYEFDASIMITASHNPKEYNGLKISGREAIPIGYDAGLKLIENKIQQNIPIDKMRISGKMMDFDFKDDYLQFQKQYLHDLSGLNMVIDCSNGMAGILIRNILGDDPVYINETPDGNFPNHDPNPLEEKNLIQLQQTVNSGNFDVGVIFDGDADRVMFVDENGNFIPPDLIIALLGHFFLDSSNKGKSKVLQDIRSSKSVGEYLQPMGGQMETWKVGRAFAAKKLKKINGLFGGELAGHYYFRDFYYSDSGIMACLIVLGITNQFKEQGISLSQLIKRIKKYENSGEINFRIEKKTEAMTDVVEFFTSHKSPDAYYNFDGFRLEYKDWWFNIRPSNTEPYLRLLVEAMTKERLQEKLNEIKTILEKYQ
ncbi:MAG: phosphomannomutase/phosphoglucomutase [Bacteroidales bacterium]|nr:phosphomannomutase/phosphoglucomutase [Bacteroidales bacterium]